MEVSAIGWNELNWTVMTCFPFLAGNFVFGPRLFIQPVNPSFCLLMPEWKNCLWMQPSGLLCMWAHLLTASRYQQHKLFSCSVCCCPCSEKNNNLYVIRIDVFPHMFLELRASFQMLYRPISSVLFLYKGFQSCVLRILGLCFIFLWLRFGPRVSLLFLGVKSLLYKVSI